MASVRMDDAFVDQVKSHAAAQCRSVPKQIEHWARLGKAAEENPELPFSFIRDVIEAGDQMAKGACTPYVRRTR